MASSSSSSSNNYPDHRQGRSDTFNRNIKPYSAAPSSYSQQKDLDKNSASKWDSQNEYSAPSGHSSSYQYYNKSSSGGAASTTSSGYPQRIPTPPYSGGMS